ncbi:hypothetical protein PCASD_02962 [Puccinia coronata f. sp. avenae]|uniref:Uncharacterized protein n=1 Tax=Puccinia coronata f. sp. avenae TaxID=200324 RepID=A0A2N5VGR6_9BASI|nr:hypothetical protein PCASD_02962 [Puccinia coronata f. sp. avenae]
MGLRHQANVHEHHERLAREQRQRIEMENEGELNDDLDAISAAFAGLVKPNVTAGNNHEEFGFNDFVNAKLEEILRQEDNAMYDGEPNEVFQETPAKRSRFVKGEDLKKELESMEGYDDRDWKTLRKSMLDVWGGSPLKIRYTIQDLYDLIKLCQDKGGIKDIKDFRIYQSKFMMITKYLVRNEHIPAKTSVSHLFFLAFPREYQVSINRELVKSDLIPTGKDGYNKPPMLEDVMEVAEDEVRARSINAFEAGSNFAAANKEMQKNLDLKKGDGKKREKMLEEYPKEPVQSQIESMAKAIEALASKLNAPAKAEYSRGNEAPSGRLYEPRPCSYCHREGHNSAYCHEAQKDEREGLVKRDGKFFNLPSGERIPWDPSRPIRSVVATESAKPKAKINTVYATDNSAVFQVNRNDEEPSDIQSAMQHIVWDPPKLGSEEALKSSLPEKKKP